jgi:UDP-glucose 4-epimerase
LDFSINLCNGRRENLEGLDKKQVQLVAADFRDGNTLSRYLGGIDVLFHMACLGVRHSIHSPEENHEVNANGTFGLLALAREKKVKRFVYVSSSEVYGSARSVPMSEEHPTFPRHVYGAAKLAAECYTRAFYESYQFPTVVIRPFNTYGPRCHHEGDSGEVIPKFILRCLAGLPMIIFSDGKQTRDFTYVSDTAHGILLAGQADQAIGETINLGNNLEISINELSQTVASVTGCPNLQTQYEPPRPGDTGRLLADVTKAKKMLGFQPKVSLRQGIEEIRDWYLSMKVSPAKLLESEIVHNWIDPKIKTYV